jgi:hypothetical protein
MIEYERSLDETCSESNIDWNAYAVRLSQYVMVCVLNKGREEVLRVAGEVLTLSNGRLVSVTELVKDAAAHGWNSMIYEAWAWEYSRRIYAHKRTMPGLVWDALRITASQSGDLDISKEEAYAAIREARQELYG